MHTAMRPIRPSPFLFAAAPLLAVCLPAQGTERLTFADTQKAISWVGAVPSARWAKDGAHV